MATVVIKKEESEPIEPVIESESAFELAYKYLHSDTSPSEADQRLYPVEKYPVESFFIDMLFVLSCLYLILSTIHRQIYSELQNDSVRISSDLLISSRNI